MYHIDDLFCVEGEKLILKEESETSLFFWARKYDRHIKKSEFVGMIQSGAATLIRKGASNEYGRK
jgi:hypothetical protein